MVTYPSRNRTTSAGSGSADLHARDVLQKKTPLSRGAIALAVCLILAAQIIAVDLLAANPGVRKLDDIVLYEDARFYSSFPSIVRRPNGELLVAFRRAPERRLLGETGITHTDPNSYLMLVRSSDGGKSWSQEPQLLFAHPFGGSQDPCLLQLGDGTILCASYAWARLQQEAMGKLKQPMGRSGDFAFLGGFLMHSRDGGKSWLGPTLPPPCRGEAHMDIFGNGVPAYNRGAMCEGKNGRVYWVVASGNTNLPRRTAVHLLVSPDKGNTWEYSCPVAQDPAIQFNETSMYETPKGDLVAFVRTEGFNDHTVVARSTDQGHSFQWQDAGFQGHPHHALRLPDKRVLLVYGYRHRPFGVRARVLDPECRNFATAEEIVLRPDGGTGDLGYPWSVMVSKNRALVVYYFNRADGTRHIAGTFLEID